MNEELMIDCRDLRKSYRTGAGPLAVLNGVSLQVSRGQWVTLLGASGSGKTTLLNLLGTLERPDGGSLFLAGQDAAALSSAELVRFRCRKIGFVFQAYHLLPELTLLENVMLPGRLCGRSSAAVARKAAELLERAGLKDRMQHRPGELSGGEQQRGAIARALINDPELLLADEPTGNLDGRTGEEILKLLTDLRGRDAGRTMVLITHNEALASLGDAAYVLQDGVLKEKETGQALR